MNSNDLKTIVDNSGTILITSHVSPDPDAVCSVLLLTETLKNNYQDKKIFAVLEEKPSQDLSFLKGYDGITFQPIAQTIKDHKPDLLVIVDANSYKRISREEADEIQTLVAKSAIKTAVIDHHEPDDKDQ